MRAGERNGDDSSVTGEIDLARIARAISAKRWWVIGPTVAMFAGSAIFVNVVKPRYSAEARVLLENQENFIPRADKTERAAEILPDPEAVQSQIQLLTSRDLARRVIKMLDLQGNDEFDPLAHGAGATTRALMMLGLARDPTQTSPEDRILETFGDKLSVLSPTKTRVLSIEFTSRNPDLAAKGANAVAEAYLEFQQDAKRDHARGAANSLAALVAQLRARVAEADAEAEQFRVKSGLLVGSNNTTINAQRLSDLNTQLSLSRSAQADAQAKARLLRDMLRQNRIGDIPDVANNEVIRRLQEQRVTLRAQLALESRTLLPGHPRIKELQAQLQDLDAQGRAAAERVARTLENDAHIAGARVENLTRALEEQKTVVGAADADDVRLRDLERTARLYKEQLESATAKYQEAMARENSQATPPDARIFQRALAPQIPSFPKKIPIVSFATLSALILSIGGVLSGELLSGRPRVAPSAPRLAGEAVELAPANGERASPTLAEDYSGAPTPPAAGEDGEESQPAPELRLEPTWASAYRGLRIRRHAGRREDSRRQGADCRENRHRTSLIAQRQGADLSRRRQPVGVGDRPRGGPRPGASRQRRPRRGGRIGQGVRRSVGGRPGKSEGLARPAVGRGRIWRGHSPRRGLAPAYHSRRRRRRRAAIRYRDDGGGAGADI